MKNNANKPEFNPEEYFRLSNVSDFETLGRVYAGMNSLEFSGDESKVDMNKKYAELGEAVYKMYEGFFYEGSFYGKTKDTKKS